MVAVTHITCPKCSRVFYFQYQLYKTEFMPLCPYCKHTFKQEESPNIWDESERRGWGGFKLK